MWANTQRFIGYVGREIPQSHSRAAMTAAVRLGDERESSKAMRALDNKPGMHVGACSAPCARAPLAPPQDH